MSKTKPTKIEVDVALLKQSITAARNAAEKAHRQALADNVVAVAAWRKATSKKLREIASKIEGGEIVGLQSRGYRDKRKTAKLCNLEDSPETPEQFDSGPWDRALRILGVAKHPTMIVATDSDLVRWL